MTRATAKAPGQRSSAAPPEVQGRIGPNAITQMIGPLTTLYGHQRCLKVFTEAGLQDELKAPPTTMVPEVSVQSLFRAIRAEFSIEQADELLSQGGQGTAHYVMQNRIPAPVRKVLKFLPGPLSARLLLKAIGKHAWTFAGTGQFACQAGRKLQVSITNNPIATPSCPWHLAVFSALFRELADPGSSVTHTQCAERGDTMCVFDITL